MHNTQPHPKPQTVRRHRQWRLVAAIWVSTGVSGCSESVTELVCTMEFRILTIQVRDESGLPVPDAVLGVRRSNTDAAWPAATTAGVIDAAQGTYAVIDDSHLPLIKRNERVPVTLSATRVARPGATSHATWEVTSDGCHVSRVSGADTLIMTGADS